MLCAYPGDKYFGKVFTLVVIVSPARGYADTSCQDFFRKSLLFNSGQMLISVNIYLKFFVFFESFTDGLSCIFTKGVTLQAECVKTLTVVYLFYDLNS